jgi:hypothetical protein
VALNVEGPPSATKLLSSSRVGDEIEVVKIPLKDVHNTLAISLLESS